MSSLNGSFGVTHVIFTINPYSCVYQFHHLTKNVCFCHIPRTHKLCRPTIRGASTPLHRCTRRYFLFQPMSVISIFGPLYFGLLVVRTGFEPASLNRGRARYQFGHLTVFLILDERLVRPSFSPKFSPNVHVTHNRERLSHCPNSQHIHEPFVD